MLLPALLLLSIAYLLASPIAVLAILASIAYRASDGIELAVVVSRRQRTGSKGQRVIASIRINRSTVTRAARAALTAGRALRSTAHALARAAARRADEQADRAGALALTLSVWLAPWVLVEAAAGSGWTVAGYALALALGGAWIRATRPDVRALVHQTDPPRIGR